MLRRNFIRALGYTTIAVPWIAAAQQSSSKVWRIAYLYPGSLAAPGDQAIFGVFRAEMATMGYVEGKNLIIDDRSAEGKLERLPSFLTELIALRPDVIVAITTAAIAAAQKATSTIPIIMAPSVDPIGSGFVKEPSSSGGKHYWNGRHGWRRRGKGCRTSPRRPAIRKAHCRAHVQQSISSMALRDGRSCH
jgi:putative ABC transport system substrate-binding protein